MKRRRKDKWRRAKDKGRRKRRRQSGKGEGKVGKREWVTRKWLKMMGTKSTKQKLRIIFLVLVLELPSLRLSEIIASKSFPIFPYLRQQKRDDFVNSTKEQKKQFWNKNNLQMGGGSFVILVSARPPARLLNCAAAKIDREWFLSNPPRLWWHPVVMTT